MQQEKHSFIVLLRKLLTSYKRDCICDTTRNETFFILL